MTCLFGAVGALHETLGNRRSVPVVQNIDSARTDASLAANRAMLAPTAFEAAWRKGQAMTLDEAVAFALAATRQTPPPMLSTPPIRFLQPA